MLVEKPAVLRAAEWRDLVARSRRAGVVLLEAMRTAYDPGTSVVRSLLPELGVLRTAMLRYQKRSSRYDQVLAGERVNMFDPDLGGGALADLGVYCIHSMVSLFGAPDRITAAAVGVASGVDGAGSITAEYPGMLVDLAYSKITSTTLPSEVQGEDGTMIIDQIASPRVVQLIRRDGEVFRQTVDGAGQQTRWRDQALRGTHRHGCRPWRGSARHGADARIDGAREAHHRRLIDCEHSSSGQRNRSTALHAHRHGHGLPGKERSRLGSEICRSSRRK